MIEISGLYKSFPVARGPFRRPGQLQALRGVDLEIRRGETLGLVGESGCGKTTLGRCVLRLVEPSRGTIRFDGVDVTLLRTGELRSIRKRMQIVFQDPYSSLNPRLTIGDMLEEPLVIHGLVRGSARRRERVRELLRMVGLPADAEIRYPHEFSGGQRQRIGIARALAVEPDFIVCDEPVSALDVSVQAQIVNLLKELQSRLGLTYLFISHDLRLVRYLCHRVAVMYLGRIVESGTAEQVYGAPQHPYTQALLSAVPFVSEAKRRQRIVLSGEPPRATDPPTGCAFRARCFRAEARCAVEDPKLREARGSAGHCAACVLVGESTDSRD